VAIDHVVTPCVLISGHTPSEGFCLTITGYYNMITLKIWRTRGRRIGCVIA
jgi:hypothetical protein